MLDVSSTASLMMEVRQLLGGGDIATQHQQSSASSCASSAHPPPPPPRRPLPSRGGGGMPSSLAMAPPPSDIDPLLSIHAKHPQTARLASSAVWEQQPPASAAQHFHHPHHHAQTAASRWPPGHQQHAPFVVPGGGGGGAAHRDHDEDVLDGLARPAVPLDPADAVAARAFAEERRRLERVPILVAHREMVSEDVAGAREAARTEVAAALQAYHGAALELAVLRERAALVDVARDAETAQVEAALELAAEEQGLRRERCNELDAKLRGLAERKIGILARHLDRVHAEARADSGLSDAASSRSGAASGPNRTTPSRAGSQRGDPNSRRAGSPAASQRGGGGSSGAADAAGSQRGGGVADSSDRHAQQKQQQQLRGMSPGKRAWAKVKQRLLGAALTSVSQKRGNTASALRGGSSGAVMVIGEDGVPTNAPSFVCGPLTKAAVDGYFAGRRAPAASS